MRRFTIRASEAGQRADVFIASKLPAFSRSILKSLFDSGKVELNGKLIKPSVKLPVGDDLRVDITGLKPKVVKVQLPVIYEDENVIVINKPSGVLTHSKGAVNLEATVASFIAPKIADKTLEGNRAGIVHRLDRGTSGVIIAAKNKATLDYLQRQFAKRQVHKTYLAVVEGRIYPAEALIDAPIGRNPKQPQTFRVAADGKSAQTHYKSLKTMKSADNIFSLVELKPKTGRTHQLRVHLAYIGHPIVGDEVYGKSQPPIKLHAVELELKLPDGKMRKFKTNPPKDFLEL